MIERMIIATIIRIFRDAEGGVPYIMLTANGYGLTA